MQRLVDWLVYVAVRLVLCVVQSARLETCAAWARLLGKLATDVVPLRRQVIDDNLRHAFPELDARDRRRLTRQMWEHLFLMVFESAHMPRKLHQTNWRRYVRILDERGFGRFMLDPRPRVMVGGHFGNFEAAGYMAGLLGHPTYSVARPLDNPYLDRLINRLRGRTGQHIIPKQGSAEFVQRVLDAGGILGLLGDQNAGAKGCWVNFLGRPASSHKGIALFTLTTGAPLAVGYAKRVGGPLQFEACLVEIIDPRRPSAVLAGVGPLTQWYNDRLGEIVRSAPAQYWWVHRRWKGEPPAAVARRLRSEAASRPAA